MLERYGRINVNELVEAARFYIPLYDKEGTAMVPFKHKGKVRYVRFVLLAGNWVYINVK